MALVGGGGAGNVAGSNPSGTGTNVAYIGRSRIDDRDYWQGFSGGVLVNASTATQFEFTSPTIPTVATYVFTDTGAAGSNQYISYRITLDGQVVLDARFFTGSSANPTYGADLDVPVTFAIPAFSDVKIEASVAESENHTTYGMLMLKEI